MKSKAKIKCIECHKNAYYIRRTQFAGDHPYCKSCALKESDFGKKDSSYYFWCKLK